jgi:hypothetical protein
MLKQKRSSSFSAGQTISSMKDGLAKSCATAAALRAWRGTPSRQTRARNLSFPTEAPMRRLHGMTLSTHRPTWMALVHSALPHSEARRIENEARTSPSSVLPPTARAPGCQVDVEHLGAPPHMSGAHVHHAEPPPGCRAPKLSPPSEAPASWPPPRAPPRGASRRTPVETLRCPSTLQPLLSFAARQRDPPPAMPGEQKQQERT